MVNIVQSVDTSLRRRTPPGIPDRGVVMFAFNNPTVNYGLIALCNALCIKRNMNENHVTLICDHDTHESIMKEQPQIARKAINHWVHTENPSNYLKNMRTIRDTRTSKIDMIWNNKGRQSVWELSPYNETLLVDSDYFILDNTLDHCWGSNEDIMFNRTNVNIDPELSYNPNEKICDTGIPLYWATCVYFNRTELSELFFETCHHISDNYDYYCLMYKLPGRLYRNDFVFSIAAHILSGMTGRKFISPLPVPHILTSWDKDELIALGGPNNFRFLISHDNNSYSYTGIRDMNIHIMNKLSIMRVASDIINTYAGDVLNEQRLLHHSAEQSVPRLSENGLLLGT